MSFSNQSPQQDLYDNSIYHDPTNVDGYALISPPSTYTFSVRSGHVPLPDWSPHQSSFSANLYETYVHLPHPSSNSHTHSTNTRHSSPRNDSQSIVSGVNAATTSTSGKALDSLSFAPLSSSSDPLLSHPMDSYYPRDRKASDHHGLSYLADDYNYTIPPPSLGPHSNGLHPERSPTASSYGAASHDFHHYDYSEPAQNPQPLAHGHLLPPLSFELPVQTGSQDLTSPTPYSGHQLLSPFVENGPLSPSISVAYGGHPSSPEAYIPHRRLSNESGRQSVFTSTLSTGSVYSINSSPVIEKIPDSNSHQSAHPPVSPTGPFSPSQITSRQAVISPGSFSDSSALSSPVAQRSVTSHHTPAVSPTIAQPRVTAHTISPVASLAAESGLSSPVQPVPSNRTEPQVSGPSKEATSQNVSPPSTTNGAGAKEKAKTEFQCPGCDLTFGRLSALKQHMLSHTGEKPHACELCGRRFSLASNLRRHTSTKACRVMKFETAKQSANASVSSAATPLPVPASVNTSPVISIATPRPAPVPVAVAVSAPAPAIAIAAAIAVATAPSSPIDSPPKTRQKRKAPAETKVVRRKRHANQEERWIPRTLALFKNAHLLTSTPPFQFCISRNVQGDDAEPEPFSKPTLPLHPVRPSVRGHRSRLSTSSSNTSESSYDDSTGPSDGSRRGSFEEDDSDYEERDSYDENAPEYPYHPSSWNESWCKLPGPGLLGGDELVKRASVARRWMTFRM